MGPSGRWTRGRWRGLAAGLVGPRDSPRPVRDACRGLGPGGWECRGRSLGGEEAEGRWLGGGGEARETALGRWAERGPGREGSRHGLIGAVTVQGRRRGAGPRPRGEGLIAQPRCLQGLMWGTEMGLGGWEGAIATIHRGMGGAQVDGAGPRRLGGNGQFERPARAGRVGCKDQSQSCTGEEDGGRTREPPASLRPLSIPHFVPASVRTLSLQIHPPSALLRQLSS